MKKIGIGIIGLGNIGSRLYKEIISNKKDIGLKTNTNINIIAISAKNINKKRSFKVKKKIFFKNALDIVKNPKVNIVIELIGKSDGISKKIVENSLKNKKHVITANKALISKHGDYLTTIAEKNKVNLEFEAAVGGGIPVLRTIKEGLATNKILKVYGILNGTCNYILSEMESTNDSFKNVLSKVKILSSLAFNNKISNSKNLMEGIENIESKDFDITDQLNYRIKLLGITELINNQLFERVHPCLVKKNSYIGNVNGVMNAVIAQGNPVGESILQGEGAGPGPTSSALMSDLLSILRGNIKYPFGIPSSKRKVAKIYNFKNYSNSLYLRFEVKDKPGVLSQITKLLAQKNISVERLIQIPDHKRKRASIVIITHKSKEIDAQNCLKSFRSNKNIIKLPVLIRLFK